MRLLHHDKEILELTFVLLLNGAANQNQTERTKNK